MCPLYNNINVSNQRDAEEGTLHQCGVSGLHGNQPKILDFIKNFFFT